MIKPIPLAAGLLILGLIYLFQKESLAMLEWFGITRGTNASFAINRTLRLLLNDIACMAIIYAIFRERKYLVVATYVLLFELTVMLPTYLIIKLSVEGPTELSSPLLSQIHRLIVNPLLMFVLIAGLLYQKYAGQKV